MVCMEDNLVMDVNINSLLTHFDLAISLMEIYSGHTHIENHVPVRSLK